MIGTKYILEYTYNIESDDWREEGEFNRTDDAHLAFIAHVKEHPHITLRVRKVRYVLEEHTVASFQPISSEEYEDE